MLLSRDHLFGLLLLKINVVNSEFHISEIIILVFQHFSVNAQDSMLCLGDK